MSYSRAHRYGGTSADSTQGSLLNVSGSFEGMRKLPHGSPQRRTRIGLPELPQFQRLETGAAFRPFENGISPHRHARSSRLQQMSSPVRSGPRYTVYRDQVRYLHRLPYRPSQRDHEGYLRILPHHRRLEKSQHVNTVRSFENEISAAGNAHQGRLRRMPRCG